MTSVVHMLQGCLKHSIANSSIRPRQRLGEGTTLRLRKADHMTAVSTALDHNFGRMQTARWSHVEFHVEFELSMAGVWCRIVLFLSCSFKIPTKWIG